MRISEGDLQLMQAYIAAAACENLESADGYDWPVCGGAADHLPVRMGSVANDLAAFTREHSSAPAEALYRHARALKIHDQPADAWPAIEGRYRLAYSVFHAVLPILDRLAKEEAERYARDNPPPPRGETLPASDTTLEEHERFDARHDDRDQFVRLGAADSDGHGETETPGAPAVPEDAAVAPDPDEGGATADAPSTSEDAPVAQPFPGEAAAPESAGAPDMGDAQPHDAPAETIAIAEGPETQASLAAQKPAKRGKKSA